MLWQAHHAGGGGFMLTVQFECVLMYFKEQTYTHTLSKVKMLVFSKVTNELSVLVTVVVCACGTT